MELRMNWMHRGRLEMVGGSPGLVVKGGDSYQKFESRCRILDGHFFTLICFKNCDVCLKRPKINKIEAEDGPFFKIGNGVENMEKRCKGKH